MLTKSGHALLATSLALLAAGLTFGNYAYLLVGSFPLFIVLAAIGLDEPRDVRVERNVSRTNVRAGDRVTVEVRVACAGGRGLLEVHVPLPEPFELVEGSNLHLLRKDAGPLEASFAFTFRATKRGTWSLPATRLEAVHALGLRDPVAWVQGDDAVLEVKPRLAGLRRTRAAPGFARRIFPENDEARIGVQTTDFREIRDYAFGDPPSAINWKATARRQAGAAPLPGGGAMPALPLVNEYEREGKKTVFLFVDAAAYMEVGTSVENAFERGLEAAGSVARFYLDRGYRLGAYVYNAQDQLLHPDTGRRQFLRLGQVLLRLAPSPPRQGLRAAVERCRGYLVNGRPLVVVVTRATEDTDGLADGLRRLRAITGRRRRLLPVVVVTPSPYALLPAREEYGEDVVTLLSRLDRPALSRVRRLGAAVVEWDPRRHGFESAFLRGAR
ncbi:MAG TPA: DUF58 domain-containing protein [Candidatus Thermoplasmatota archaeon]|nr:DUF58 domain-containing protein [Candidatus Thermoplasmatota archaeon]